MSNNGLKASPDWDEGVLASLYQAAFATSDREVAGVLVGSPAAAGAPQIRAVIPAAEGLQVGQAAQFTHQTWAHVHQAMADHYQGLEVVGWYLSRPGQGTGLTDADTANHHRWFGLPHQVLLMLDSRSLRGALYTPGPTGLVQVHEGPVARRYTNPAPSTGVAAAVALLVTIGVLLGAFVFAIAVAFNNL